MSEHNLMVHPKRTAFFVAIVYVLISCIYVFFSDRLAFLLFADDKGVLAWVVVLKGWAFVFVSGILIYAAIFIVLKKIIARERENVSERILYEEKLEKIAYIDSQTKLPNRSSLDKQLSEKISDIRQEQAAVYFIDLDNFKYINDTLGHAFGDLLISAVADILVEKLNGDAEIYRFGGDEFVIFVSKCDDIEKVKAFAERIADCFKYPFMIEENSVDTTVSIGAARYPEDGETLDELLKYADLAMYRAKAAGRNRYVIYNADMKSELLKRGQMEQYLRTALDNNEFEVVYQPQYAIATKRITGFEALIRWHSPQLGLVSPDQFIPVAEDTHLMVAIGEWVLRTACVFLKQLHNQIDHELCMSVNVSVLQLLQEDFDDTVLHVLDFVDIRPKYLELEITESILMESYDSIRVQLKRLMGKGVKIALDDFGQGYSSLSYLKDIPLSTLKIDKVFIDSILEEDQEKSIISDIIAIGRKMGLEVIAEGVEVPAQLEYLIRSSCDKIQGYYISKPLNETAALDFVGEDACEISDIYKGFRWKPEYSVKVDSIDVQHKRLFEIGREAATLLFEENDADVRLVLARILSELEQYAVYHFTYEQEIMKQYDYPHYETHCTEHEEIIERLSKARELDFAHMDKHDLKNMVDFIFVWISNHILKTDRRYSKYLNNKGVY